MRTTHEILGPGYSCAAFKFRLVSLSDWAAMSMAAQHAAKMLLAFAGETATRVANRRRDLPHDFDGLVKQTPPNMRPSSA